MVDRKKEVKVTNRFDGTLGYKIDDLGIKRQYQPNETKIVTFEELEKLSYEPGGLRVIKEYLKIDDIEVVKELLPGYSPEETPEYYYTDEDLKRIILTSTENEFLDCLDFAPEGVIERLKTLATELPIKNTDKNKALFEKTGYNAIAAYENAHAKFDNGDTDTAEETKTAHRRVSVASATKEEAKPARRVIVKKED